MFIADPTGFLELLNPERVKRGLSPVVFSPELYDDACQNNDYQKKWGIGHFYMGRARRQNAAIGQTSNQEVLQAWENDPPHAAALFDPDIKWGALACDGNIYTFNAS